MSYPQDKVRNILIAGHSGSGKTSLAESLLFLTNGSDRLGRVEDGNTVCDFEAQEIKRKASLSLAIAPVEADGLKYNLLDVPGLFDFELGINEGLMAAESVLVCVSARDGLAVGAQKAYKAALNNNKARMIYVSKIDVENADFYKVLEEMKVDFGPSICPVVVPVEQAGGRVYLNLITQKAYAYVNGKSREVPVPAFGHRLEGLIAAISEAIAETDDELMEKFFSGEAFTQEELFTGVRAGVKSGAITPVFCGSNTKLEGLDMLIEGMRKLLPSAARSAGVVAYDRDLNEVEIPCDSTGPVVARVFRTVADPFVGKLSYVKVISGILKADTSLINSTTGDAEKFGKLLYVKGKKQDDISEVGAGDVCAVTKFSGAQTGDVLCAPSKVVTLDKPAFPNPSFTMAIKVKQKGDESKISSALQRLMEEDKTLDYVLDTQTMQQLISGMGEQHLEVVISKMKTKFGVEVSLVKPIVAYRETIRKKVKAQGKHKKQSGGHGQFGDVWIEFEPHDGDELIFAEKVFGGSVPKNYFPAVEKGLQGCISHGPIAGYPVVGLKATLLDGSYHPVDSSEMAFKMAASAAYKTAMPDASPVLLEPVGLLKAHVPNDNTGDVLGEVNKRRGRVLGMTPEDDGNQLVEAEVPTSEMFDFTTFVRSLTQGRGYFTFEHVRYEPLPQQLEGKVVEAAKLMNSDKED